MKRILKYREVLSGLIHLLFFALALSFSFMFRFEFNIPPHYWTLFLQSLPVIVAMKFVIFYYFAVYKASWRYASVSDLFNIIKASTVSTMLLGISVYFLNLEIGFPRSVIFTDWFLTIMIVGGAKLFLRILREEVSTIFTKTGPGRKVLIVGAGDAGETLIRELKKYPAMNYQAVGFVDDNPSKINTQLHGVRIYGPIDKLPELVESLSAEEILIAIPSATGAQMRRIVRLAEQTGKPFRTIPGLDHLIDGRVTVNKLRSVEIEDLLRREPVRLDSSAIERFLTGRVILVTGAGGSIGSEICRQVIRFGPRVLIMLDQAETALFQIERELTRYAELPGRLVAKIGDICDEGRMAQILAEHKPEVIFHCAAYKHVPLMEFNIREAIKNNILGTKILAKLAHRFGVQSFVFISTDKAVNPTSIMGASKRAAEKYLQIISRTSKTRFIIVRFGNVLASQGSVVEIFRKQIQEGGPLTVTHPDMRRYFMTISEASQLVLQAASIGKGGEIYFLEMGEPIRIVELARELIRLSGLKPEEDIQIIFTGIRPGEKLFEELKFKEEDMLRTEHEKIHQLRMNGFITDDIKQALEDLNAHLLDAYSEEELRRWLGKIVSEYSSGVNLEDELKIEGGRNGRT